MSPLCARNTTSASALSSAAASTDIAAAAQCRGSVATSAQQPGGCGSSPRRGGSALEQGQPVRVRKEDLAVLRVDGVERAGSRDPASATSAPTEQPPAASAACGR